MGMVKTKEEIDKLRKAAVLGEGCFKNVCKKIKIGMTGIKRNIMIEK